MDYKFISDISVNLIQHCGSDQMIAAAAWVSTSAEEGLQRAIEKPEDVDGIIKYLMKHRHGTPYEHNSMTFCVHAPIFVWREWHRHRIASYNEESGRYKQLAPVFYIPPRDRPMMKVDGWKPGRPKFLHCESELTYETIIQNLCESYRLAYDNYESNLALGIDPGLARDCLPVGIYSSCWVTVNARALMNFLSLRIHDPSSAHVSYPLYEIDVAARKVEAIFAQLFPITYKEFCANGRVAP